MKQFDVTVFFRGSITVTVDAETEDEAQNIGRRKADTPQRLDNMVLTCYDSKAVQSGGFSPPPPTI